MVTQGKHGILQLAEVGIDTLHIQWVLLHLVGNALDKARHLLILECLQLRTQLRVVVLQALHRSGNILGVLQHFAQCLQLVLHSIVVLFRSGTCHRLNATHTGRHGPFAHNAE